MKKMDHYLLTHFPVIWQSRIHVVFACWLLYAVLCFLAGALTPISDANLVNTIRNESDVTLLLSIISILGTVIYFLFLVKYNYFKWFGQDNPFYSLLHFLLLFACFYMIHSGYPVYRMAKIWFHPDDQAYQAYQHFSLFFLFYITLHVSVYTYLFRHVKGRQFTVGFILFGLAFIVLMLFLGLIKMQGGGSFSGTIFFFSIIALAISQIIARATSNTVFVACLVFYHSFLPYTLQWLHNMMESDSGWYNRTGDQNELAAFLITLFLIFFFSGPAMRRQWGREE